MEIINVEKKSSSKVNKIAFLEFLRVICVLAVILDHVAIAGEHIFDSSATNLDRFICYGVTYWSHFAVPIFLMISGYLLLNPAREVGYDKALGKYTKRMAVVIAFFGTIFAWLEIFFNTRSFALVDIWRAIYNMLSGESWSHMWYLYVLVGLYLVLPILKPIFQSLSTKTIDCFLCILFLFCSIFPMIENLTGFSFGVKLPIVSAYLLYFLLGRRVGMMNIEDMTKKASTYIWLVVLMLIPIGVAYMETMLGMERYKLASYSSPFIILLSILMFVVFMSIDGKLTTMYQKSPWGGVIKHISAYSFGIYITHMIWINVLYKLVRFNLVEHNLLLIIPLVLVILILSDITTIVCKKIPFVGKYI